MARVLVKIKSKDHLLKEGWKLNSAGNMEPPNHGPGSTHHFLSIIYEYEFEYLGKVVWAYKYDIEDDILLFPIYEITSGDSYAELWGEAVEELNTKLAKVLFQ